jgi:dihydrofolate synthase / folylpolyglutamate synthase
MNYRETLDYLFSQLPMFQRIGQAAYKNNLDNTYALLNTLGNPHLGKVKYVHIAGTNGKGSVSCMIASVLQEAGYKTGLFTSPHLKDFRERIRINGQMISEAEVVQFVKNHRADFERIQPSFFEMTAALAFKHFAENEVEIAVMETGMGGRLDSTNVITPEVSVITNIGLDHTQFLGETIEAIAAEKAGIIKTGIPVVCGEMRAAALEVIKNKAQQLNSTVVPLVNNENGYTTDLSGNYQRFNLPVALTALEVLQQSALNLPEKAIRLGLEKVKTNTGLLGRWQVLQTNPLSICDVAHNVDGLTEVLAQINSLSFKNLHFVLAMVGDKDFSTILGMLPKNATYYFCQANIPRALDKNLLAQQANAHNLIGRVYPTVLNAYQTALQNADSKDLVFTGGSVFTVAEIL